jgi:hypothetical protein
VPTAFRRRLVALVGAAALCVAVPGAALADQGGVPNENTTKPCPTTKAHTKAKGPKKPHAGNGKSAGKGKKCGFTHVVNGS